MAVQTIYILATTAVTPNFWGNTQLNGSAPTGANTVYGWGPGKTSTTTPYYAAHLGATSTSGTAAVSTSVIDPKSGPTKGTGSTTTTAGDSFVAGPFTGTFANTAWTFAWNLRAGTAGAVGNLRMRVWKSANADGSSATALTSSTQVGAIVTLSTTADTNSSMSWSPGAITLSNEYLFFQLEWQETTTGSSNSDTVLFRAGTAAITTPNLSTAWAGSAAFAGAGNANWDNVDSVDLILSGMAALASAASLTVDATRQVARVPIQIGTATPTGALFHFNTDIIDSFDGHIATVNGSAALSTTQPKFAAASLHIPSDGLSYLTLDGSSDFNFGTGDFTIDCWIYPQNFTDTIGYINILDFTPLSGSGAYLILYYRKDYGGVHFLDGLGDDTGGTTVMSIGAWYHVALTRAAGQTRLFLNGVQQGSTFADSNNYGVGASRPAIAGSGYWGGGGNVEYYCSELRIIKGSAAWTANFTPPFSIYSKAPPMFGTPQGGLWHFDKDHTDSFNGHTLLRYGFTDFAEYISSAQSKFGGASLQANLGFLITDSTADFDFGYDDFTIDAWLYIPSARGNSEYDIFVTGNTLDANNNNDYFMFRVLDATTPPLECYSPNASIGHTVGGNVTFDTWHHVALTRSGGTLQVFVDGTSLGTADGSTMYVTNQYPSGARIGGGGSAAFWLDEVRVLKGVAAWTSNFTPPTAPYPSLTRLSADASSFTPGAGISVEGSLAAFGGYGAPDLFKVLGAVAYGGASSLSLSVGAALRASISLAGTSNIVAPNMAKLLGAQSFTAVGGAAAFLALPKGVATALSALGALAGDATKLGGVNLWQGSAALGASAALAIAATRYNAAGIVFTEPLIGQSNNWQGLTLRQVFGPDLLANVVPGAIGVQFQFAPGTNGSLDAAYIGHAAASGDPYDFDGNQVQLKFSGSVSQAVVGAQTVNSDQVTFALDVTRPLIVSAAFSGTQVNLMGYGG